MNRHRQEPDPEGGRDHPRCGEAVGERGLGERTGEPAVGGRVFSALLQAEIMGTALLGGPVPDAAAIRTRAHQAATDLLALAEAGRL
ncbi:hypothetical protein ACFXJ5_26970 [Streptomyces sp. NPDC059373]